MKKYAAEVKVLVTIRIKRSPTEENDVPAWRAGDRARVFSHAEAVSFVRDAVASWGGQAPPDYVLFPTNIDVTARAVNLKRRKS